MNILIVRSKSKLSKWHQLILISCLVLGVVGATVWLHREWQSQQAGLSDRLVGAALFEGRKVLPASLTGQDYSLPTLASRCINCHHVPDRMLPVQQPSSAAAALGDTSNIGGTLAASLLRQSVRRRGGPPSHYDEQAFCRVLREGIDPALVVVSRTMPVYEVDSATCHALWVYLAQF